MRFENMLGWIIEYTDSAADLWSKATVFERFSYFLAIVFCITMVAFALKLIVDLCRLLAGDGKRHLARELAQAQERRFTACHEAGHAIVMFHLQKDGLPAISHATIIPRGDIGGQVFTAPELDGSRSMRELKAWLATLMGGYAAEKLWAGEEGLTTGPSSDLQQATQMANNMVRKYGMSNLGPIRLDQAGPTSEDLVVKIEQAVQNFLTEALNKATQIIQDNWDRHKLVADVLAEKGELSGRQMRLLIERAEYKADPLRIDSGVQSVEPSWKRFSPSPSMASTTKKIEQHK